MDERDGGAGRARRLLIGAVIFLGSESGMLALPWVHSPTRAFLVTICCHTLAGFGIGMAEPVTGTIVLGGSDGDAGTSAAGMQLADLVTPALGLALGGALIALAHDTADGVTAAIGLQLALAALATLAAARLWLARAALQPTTQTTDAAERVLSPHGAEDN